MPDIKEVEFKEQPMILPLAGLFYEKDIVYTYEEYLEITKDVSFDDVPNYLSFPHILEAKDLVLSYIKEGKNQLIIGIGCTGGKHRSVTLANELYRRMKDKGNYGMTIYHRDVNNRSK